MISNSTPENQAIMSNVGEIGEFRIRNSAKAFNILSSGLYANKIKAIIRELSCNAVDSHVAAGKADVPFEVHIPNSLEPHFSIRDFGTGLSHEQVTQIYTTYFESTKTASNEFIGALGLGSKSPFSYTDNFTVTAIKDGKKGIYSAFINGEGVPSIALMMSEDTTEESGVEVKFSVNERFDFSKFRDEAASVYKWFKLKPVVKGSTNFEIPVVAYETENVIPGVHVFEQHGHRSHQSVALMGNIAYPIDVPNATQLGNVARLLNCGIAIEFGIGEVDFQASREGLSYIPQTVAAIKNKLEKLNARLADFIAEEANKIPNMWDRALFLADKAKSPMWEEAATKYALDTKLETFLNTRFTKLATFKVPLKELEAMNIMIRGFVCSRGSSSTRTLKEQSDWGSRNAQGVVPQHWEFTVDPSSTFVTNDTKVGGSERAKYHYRNVNDPKVYSRCVYVLEPIDRAKSMQTKLFFDKIKNPPEARCVNVSSLNEKPRKESSVGRNVSILHLEQRKRGWSESIVWGAAGKLGDFDVNKTHYYVPLSGYIMQTEGSITDVKELVAHMNASGLTALKDIKVLGVRKTDLEEIKKRSNWVNLEEYIKKSLGVLDNNLMMNLVHRDLGKNAYTTFNYEVCASLVKADSPYKTFTTKFKSVIRTEHNEHSLRVLYRNYGQTFSPETIVEQHRAEYVALSNRYPMLGHVNMNSVPASVIAAYVNLVDSK